ncbi:MAG: BolA family protein [Betaproteobacteria bacterium]
MADTHVALIEARLRAALEPQSVEIEDESHKHAGHAGAATGGGHYRVRLVSRRFAGLTRLARHRLVYDALADLMQHDIHALALTLAAPDE